MEGEAQKVWTAVTVQVGLCVLILALVMWSANLKEGAGARFAHFGPSTPSVPINVFGITISNWTRWLVLVLLLIALEAVNTYTHKTYKRWYRYQLQNKQESGMTPAETMFVVTFWRIATFFPHVFKWLLVIATQQLQFLLPSLVVRILVSNTIDYHLLV